MFFELLITYFYTMKLFHTNEERNYVVWVENDVKSVSIQLTSDLQYSPPLIGLQPEKKKSAIHWQDSNEC